MKYAGIIGWPVAHSRSPIIHNHWLAEHGLEGSFGKAEVRPDDLAAFLAGLADRGWVGGSVTLPHKQAVLGLAVERERSAVEIGAANLLWLEGGRLHAGNTDVTGFMTHLAREAPDWAATDAPVLILGAGGAARAVVYGFLSAGVERVIVANRTRARADALVAALDPAGRRARTIDWAGCAESARIAGVVVNTTSLGMKGEGAPQLDWAAIDGRTVIVDIVYVPLETPFLAAARARGLRTVDGLGMLLHQAVPAFARWFGVMPEVTPALRAKVAADIEAH